MSSFQLSKILKYWVSHYIQVLTLAITPKLLQKKQTPQLEFSRLSPPLHGVNKKKRATYKTLILPVIEYASTIWSPVISDTNLQKLQTTQNSALRVITGCTSDTNTQHLHQ